MPRAKRKKQTSAWLLAVFLTVTAIFYIYANREEILTPASAPVTAAEGEMLVHMLDVGQGDALLIQINGKNMLIDAGKNDTAGEMEGRLRHYGVERLDIVIATHPHEDHIGGMAAVIDAFEIDTFLMTQTVHTTKTFENMLDAMERNDLRITPFKPGDVFVLGTAAVTTVAPQVTEYEDINNYSITVRVVFGQNSFLFTGDAEELSEQEMLNGGYELKSDVLKVGHHGSSTSTTKAFLSAVSPKIALISCGLDNSYNHPNEKIVARIEKAGAQIYRTDINGDVTLSSDGESISVTAQKGDT